MEPLRPQVDGLLLDFLRSHPFISSDFILDTRGTWRLHPQLAKRMAELAMSDIAVQEVLSWLLGVRALARLA